MQGGLLSAVTLLLCCLACSADPNRPLPLGAQGGSAGFAGASGGLVGTAGSLIVIGSPSGAPEQTEVDLGAACDLTRGVASDSEALLVRDPEILARFSLERVLTQIIETADASIPPLELLQRLFDTENAKASGVFADNLHCDDPNNPAFISAETRDCPRAEGALAASQGLLLEDELDGFVPVALVNRLDLMRPELGSCGEYHIVYAKVSGRTDPAARALLSFQAVLRSPEPTLASCRPAAELWASLEQTADVGSRADALEQFFFEGFGIFQPVVHAWHYGLDQCAFDGRCGQVQLGQGLQAPFQFRQFRLVKPAPGPEIAFGPTRVSGSLRPELFDLQEDDALLATFGFFLASQVHGVKSMDLARLSFTPQSIYEAGESAVEGQAAPNYLARVQASPVAGSFRNALGSAIIPADAERCPPDDPLTADSLLQRVSALSCAGCHAPERLIVPGREIGCGQAWPKSLGETHIDEQGEISPALREVFLPHRAKVLSTYLQACDARAIFDYFQYVPPPQHDRP